jgi:hypothetical protein
MPYILIAPVSSAPSTSTLEERSRWAEIYHKLESYPLQEGVNQDGERIFNRLSEVHDIYTSQRSQVASHRLSKS